MAGPGHGTEADPLNLIDAGLLNVGYVVRGVPGLARPAESADQGKH